MHTKDMLKLMSEKILTILTLKKFADLNICLKRVSYVLIHS